MKSRRTFMSAMGIGAATAMCGQVMANPASVPTQNPTNKVLHARRDESQLKKLGNGSFDKGMNKLGALGYELASVTSIFASGAAGFHIFKRQPDGSRISPLRYEFRRMDESAVANAGQGNFDDGLLAIESDRWELKAVTQTMAGNIGFYYFQREVTAS